MKRMISFVLLFCLVFTNMAYGATPSLKVFVNNKELKEQGIINVSGKVTRIQLKFVLDEIGGQLLRVVGKNNDARISIDGKFISITAGKKEILINGAKKTLSDAVILINDKHYVSPKLLEELLGVTVKQDIKANALYITSKTSKPAATQIVTVPTNIDKQSSTIDTNVKIPVKNEKITFKDYELEKVVRGILGKKEGDLYTVDVIKIESIKNTFNYTNRKIKYLDGIEKLSNLKELNLQNNLVSDISPLQNLVKLKTLDLGWNCIEDISALKNLIELSDLGLEDNRIKDLSPISNLTKLIFLDISDNMITDISMLKKLANLTHFSCRNNGITNIDVFHEMKALQIVSLDNNPILDVLPALKIEHYGHYTYAQIEQAGKAAELAIKNIIRPGMTDLEKEKAIHDFIATNVIYDKGAASKIKYAPAKTDPDGLYGAIIEGYSVCGGYAHTMKALGLMAGLDISYVIGEANGEGHAWNIIKLNNEYLHVDVTWDDSEGRGIHYENFNVTALDRIRVATFDYEYYPHTVRTSAEDSFKVKCNINAEVPVKKDLLVKIKLVCKAKFERYESVMPAVFPYDKKNIEVVFEVPKYLPIEEGLVEYNLSYELYELVQGVYRVKNDLSYYGYYKGGMTSLVGKSLNDDNILRVNQDLFITLLKKDSWGITYKQAEAREMDKTYALNPDDFELVTSFEDNPNHPRYRVKNTKEVVLPSYSAIYIQIGDSAVNFETDSFNYNYGGKLAIANHTASPKTIKPGELNYLLSTHFQKRKGEGPYIRLTVFDGDFSYDDDLLKGMELLKSYEDSYKILFKSKWIMPKQ